MILVVCASDESVWGSGGIALLILNLGSTKVSGQLHVPAGLRPGKVRTVRTEY
jgi:hypothetical protein